jgi:hypothetical protein
MKTYSYILYAGSIVKIEGNPVIIEKDTVITAFVNLHQLDIVTAVFEKKEAGEKP